MTLHSAATAMPVLINECRHQQAAGAAQEQHKLNAEQHTAADPTWSAMPLSAKYCSVHSCAPGASGAHGS
jgi:hypothetical protein